MGSEMCIRDRFDNLSAIDGVIEIKCRDCGKVVSIDLGRVMKGKRHIK